MADPKSFAAFVPRPSLPTLRSLPPPPRSLETIELGIETSYKQVMAIRARDYFLGDLQDPEGVNAANLVALGDGFPNPTLCENIVERSMAASRTFRRREEAKMLGFNEMSDEYNFSTDRKRILNFVVSSGAREGG